MKIEQSPQINFGIRPQLKVSKKNYELLNEVADKFDVLNRELDKNVSKKIRRNTQYIITDNNNELRFSQTGYCDHSVTFYEMFMKLPANIIAKVLARSAEIFSHGDKACEKSLNFVNSFQSGKYPKIADEDAFYDDIMNARDKHILSAVRKEFEENGYNEGMFLLAKEIDLCI